MRTKILALGFVFLFPLFLWTQPYEITEVDIFSLGKLSNSEEITVYGISIKNTLKEALEKFSKIESDLEHRGENAPYLLIVSPGFTIRSIDKRTIDSISLRNEFKDNLKGETSKYFDLATLEEFKGYITKSFGRSDYKQSDHIAGIWDKEIFYYLNGFIFERLFVGAGSEPTILLELTSKENIILKATKNGAEKAGEIKEDKVGKMPLSKTGFRQTLWGMSKEQVRKIEASELINEDKLNGALKGLDIIVYKNNIAGLECGIAYYFAENQLTRARYLFIESHTNKNLYISDYKTIKNQLTQKYEMPTRDDTIWSDDLYKGDSSEYGMAVSVGHLQYVAEWDLPETYIQLLLRGDNYKITNWVEYSGKAFKEFEKKVLERAKKDIW